jgi:hypothetical protein
MNYQTRLSVIQLLDILDREVGKKQDNTFEIKKLYTILWELNQRSTDAFIPEEYTSYITTTNRLTLVYGATVNGIVVQEGIVVNQGGVIYTLTTNDPSLTSSWVNLSNTGTVTFPDLVIQGASSINYNNIFNAPSNYISGNIIYVDRLSNKATNTRAGISKYSRDIPFSTIQAAINASVVDDTIVILPGIYDERLTVISNAKLNLLLFPSVYIRGSDTTPIITLNPGSYLKIAGMDKLTSQVLSENNSGVIFFFASNASFGSTLICENITIRGIGTSTACTSSNSGTQIANRLTLDNCISTEGQFAANTNVYNINNSTINNSGACIEISGTTPNATSITYNINNSTIISTAATAINANYNNAIDQIVNLTNSRVTGQGSIILGNSHASAIHITFNARNSNIHSSNATIPLTFSYFLGATQTGNIQNCIFTGSNAASITGAAAAGSLFAIKTVAQGTLGGVNVTKVDCVESQTGLTSF